MDPDIFILFSAFVIVGAVALALKDRTPPKKAETPKETTRWRRYRLDPEKLRSSSDSPPPGLVEEPSGLKLALRPARFASARKVRIAGADGRLEIEIVRRWHFRRRGYAVHLAGRELFEILVSKRRPGEIALVGSPPGSPLQFRGNVPNREYEILKAGKLVAMVSCERDPKTAAPARDYTLECLKSEDPAPILALALGLEFARG